MFRLALRYSTLLCLGLHEADLRYAVCFHYTAQVRTQELYSIDKSTIRLLISNSNFRGLGLDLAHAQRLATDKIDSS
jgi:hypothetical protein